MKPIATALESEMAVLGAMLQDHKAIQAARAILSEEDFFRDAHRLIYAALCDLVELRGVPVDLVTATNELRRRGQLEEVGSSAYLAALIDAVPTAATVSHYARQVAEAAHARRVAEAAQQLYVAAQAHEEHWQDHYEVVKHMMERTAPTAHDGTCRTIGDVLAEVVSASRNEQGVRHVGSQWPMLTRLLSGGLVPEELCYVGARPRIGKSAMMLEWARWLAQQKQQRVMIVSCEMSLVALGRRILTQAGAVVASALRRGHLSEGDHARVAEVVEQLKSLPITMVSGARTVPAIDRAIAAQRVKPSVVFVDYLQLLSGKGRDTRERIELNSAGLKQLAVSHKLVVVCLSSLRRPTVEAKDPPPTLSDLKESANLEHDADAILLLHRPALPMGLLSEEAMCIVAKAREAEMGAVKMRFDPAYLRYSEVTERQE